MRWPAIGVTLIALTVSTLAGCTPPGQSALRSCVKPSDHAQFVTFKSSTGESITGAVLGEGSVAFVLAPKVIQNACVWLPYARTLRDRGDRALLFDWVSDQGSVSVGEVIGATNELRREGAVKIVLIGASKGGTACLVAASTVRPPVAGVVSLSGEADYQGMDAMKSVKA